MAKADIAFNRRTIVPFDALVGLLRNHVTLLVAVKR